MPARFDALEHALKIADETVPQLTYRQLRVLVAVCRPGERPTESHLIFQLEMNRTTVSNLLRDLESIGMVRRVRDATTMRYHLHPTRTSERLLAAMTSDSEADMRLSA